MATGHHRQGGRAPTAADPATLPLLLPPSPSLLATHKAAAAGGHPWRPEERKRRCRRRASRRRARSPKAERAVVELPYVGALTGIRVSRSGFQSRTSARADGSVFVPRGGDAAGRMRAQVGPHSFIHVRVRVRVRSYSFRSEIGSFVRSFFSIKLAPVPMLDLCYSYSSDRNTS